MIDNYQKKADKAHEELATTENNPLGQYFIDTFNLDHSENRRLTNSEVMVVEDLVKDPFHLATWVNVLQNQMLIAEKSLKNTYSVEMYLMSQLDIRPDFTLRAPAAIAAYLPGTKIDDDDQLNNPSGKGYLIINPLQFWQMIQNSKYEYKSLDDPKFIKMVESFITTLMLHEIAHHVNGHTLSITKTMTPINPIQITDHQFALGAMEINDPSNALNIIEDIEINDNLQPHIKSVFSDVPSILEQGLTGDSQDLNMGPHGFPQQPSFTLDTIHNDNMTTFDKLQAYTESDLQIMTPPQSQSQNNQQNSDQNSDQQPSKLDEMVAQAQAQGMTAEEIRQLADSLSEDQKEALQQAMDDNIENATDKVGQNPGSAIADYNRRVELRNAKTTLPSLPMKLAKIRKLLDSQTRVNWAMPHQILSERLDLHRIEKTPVVPLHVWIDTSGSMSGEDLGLILGLLQKNYLSKKNGNTLILHTVSNEETGDPVTIRSKADITKYVAKGMASTGGTSFHDTLGSLPDGRHVILSDFEWFNADVTDNLPFLKDASKRSILWVDTSTMPAYNNDVTDIIKKLPTTYIALRDYEYK